MWVRHMFVAGVLVCSQPNRQLNENRVRADLLVCCAECAARSGEHYDHRVRKWATNWCDHWLVYTAWSTSWHWQFRSCWWAYIRVCKCGNRPCATEVRRSESCWVDFPLNLNPWLRKAFEGQTRNGSDGRMSTKHELCCVFGSISLQFNYNFFKYN